MAELYVKVEEDVKKAYKVKCAMDGITQTEAITRLMKLYADGKIQVVDTLNT